MEKIKRFGFTIPVKDYDTLLKNIKELKEKDNDLYTKLTTFIKNVHVVELDMVDKIGVDTVVPCNILAWQGVKWDNHQDEVSFIMNYIRSLKMYEYIIADGFTNDDYHLDVEYYRQGIATPSFSPTIKIGSSESMIIKNVYEEYDPFSDK